MLEEVRRLRPEARVIVVSAASDYRSVIRALEAGAAGYPPEGPGPRRPRRRCPHGPRRWSALAPALLPHLVSRLAEAPGSAQNLSRREVEVLQLLAEGCSTKQPRGDPGLSLNTVRNHVQSAISRLGAHSKLEAVSIAIRQGLISPPDAGPVP